MAIARSVRERQEPGLELRCFSARVPVAVYNGVTDWAWENRVSLAKALTLLLKDGLLANGKAITEEQGTTYISENGGNQHGKENG